MAPQFRRFAAALLGTTSLAFAGPVLAQGQDLETSDQPVYLEADELQEDAATSSYIALGNVRVRQEGRTLLADELQYFPLTDRVLARGNVVIIGQTPYPQFADEVELDSALSAGVALGFATMMENSGRMAAAAAIRREDGSLQLDDAYYTACELCPDGRGRPTWRLRAREVVQDVEDQMIYYRGAQLEVLGVPVLYSPRFAHPDPSSERRSGLLMPAVDLSTRLGFVYKQPYYWAISEHQDLTVTPYLMTNVNPLLYAQYRKRFWAGSLAFEGSLTREHEIDSDGERFGEENLRWHLFGGGRFAINEDWRWGFGVQRSSDDLQLRRYGFSERDKDRSTLIDAPPRNLVSQLYVESRTRNRYASAITAAYQSLRPGIDDDTLPVIAPMIDVRQVYSGPDALGRLNLSANMVVLERETGTDYRRGTVELDWRARWETPPGIVVEPFALGRADYYSLDNIEGAAVGDEADSFSRTLGLVGTEINWPFYRGGQNVDWIVEPVVSVTAASDDPDGLRVANHDSLSVDLDESMLFAPVRAPGYDVWESGVWASYGLRTTALWGATGTATAFIGRSERLDGEPVFGEASGLFEDRSDYVVAGSIDLAGFRAELDARLDTEDFDINRLSFDASYTSDRLSLLLGYLDVSDDASRRAPKREIRAGVELALTDHWSVVGREIHDLSSEVTRRRETGFIYRDECTQLEILYQQQNLGITRLGPSESIQIRVTLFTLGSVRPD